MRSLVTLASLAVLFTITSTGRPAVAATRAYDPDTAVFANPERGLVRSFNPPSCNTRTPALTVPQLTALRTGAGRICLVRKYYLLKAFRATVTLPQEILNEFDADAQACRTAGVKLIPRFAYQWCTGTGETDATLSITLGHLDQLSAHLSANQDVIAFLEAGMVGNYGEWHHSFNNHIDNYTNQILSPGLQIRDKLLQVLPPERFLAMRYLYWHKMKFWSLPLTESAAFGASAQARIGYHHDFVMGYAQWDGPSCGECPDYGAMHDYYASDTRWVPSTGEPCSSGDTYYQTHDPQPQLKALRFSTLMDNSCIDFTYWQNQGWMHGLARDLGYRIALTSATCDDRVARGNNLQVRLDITNVGYAAPYNPRRVEIVLRNRTTAASTAVDVTRLSGTASDPRYWLPGNRSISLSVPLPATLAVGTYDVLLNLPDPSPSLHDLPTFSIRLANSDMWEDSTGYNRLGFTVTIENSTGVTRHSRADGRSQTGDRHAYYDIRGRTLVDTENRGVQVSLRRDTHRLVIR